jgi:AcrR family transcriptional regulator
MQRARTREAKEDRRQQLLIAALDEFFERGFTAARMDDIAARADVSKGTLYLYFKSKEDLFQSLVDDVAIPNIEQVEAAALSMPTLEGAIRNMMSLAPALVTSSNIPKLMKIIFGDAPNFPDTVSAFREKVPERMLGLIASLIERANDAGETDIADPALAARLVVSPFVFSSMWQVIFTHDPDARFDLDALFNLHADTILRGFGINTSTAP